VKLLSIHHRQALHITLTVSPVSFLDDVSFLGGLARSLVRSSVLVSFVDLVPSLTFEPVFVEVSFADGFVPSPTFEPESGDVAFVDGLVPSLTFEPESVKPDLCDDINQ
jgi:hypothetical protein